MKITSIFWALLAFFVSICMSVKQKTLRFYARGCAILAVTLDGLRPLVTCTNIAEGVHDCATSRQADAVIATRYLLAKVGSDATHTAITALASDFPTGIIADEAAAIGDWVELQLLGATDTTRRMVASGVIAAGVKVFTDASGKVQALPTAIGTYWNVGVSLTAAAADGDVIEVDPCEPVACIAIAALGNANGAIAALTSSTATVQAEFNALRDACETLADDVRAISTALSSAKIIITGV